MKQVHEILLNRFFSSTTENYQNNSLVYDNDYFINQTGETDEIVDYSNVRNFITNESNQKIVQSYISYLTAQTIMNSVLTYPTSSSSFQATAEFKEIFYNDNKLADSFNSYYNQVVLVGANSASNNLNILQNIIDNQLVNTDDYNYAKQVIYNYNFKEDGKTRNTSGEIRMITTSTTESYFINVFLQKGHTYISRIAYEVCNSLSAYTSMKNLRFSQNPSNIAIYDSIFNSSNLKTSDNSLIDNTNLSTTPPDSLSRNRFNEDLVATLIDLNSALKIEDTIIQCFINPDFNFNQNEYWINKFSANEKTRPKNDFVVNEYVHK